MRISAAWLESSGAGFGVANGRTGYAHLKNYTAEFCEWGDGPPLLLIPGLAGGYQLLGPLARLLAQSFRVITYQLRGEDDCFALRRRFGLRELADDLNELIQWHSLERPSILGVSFGGVVALEFAVRYPGRLSHLIVQGIGAGMERGLLQRVAGTVLARYPLPSDNPWVNQFFNLFFGRPQHRGRLFEFVTRQCWQTDQSVMAHRFQLVDHFQIGPRAERVEVPTLIMAGERDPFTSPANVKRLHEGIRGSRLVTLPKCGHLAFVAHPERVADETLAFLSAAKSKR